MRYIFMASDIVVAMGFSMLTPMPRLAHSSVI